MRLEGLQRGWRVRCQDEWRAVGRDVLTASHRERTGGGARECVCVCVCVGVGVGVEPGDDDLKCGRDCMEEGIPLKSRLR